MNQLEEKRKYYTHTLNSNNALTWLHQYWGHVHLHDIELTTINK